MLSALKNKKNSLLKSTKSKIEQGKNEGLDKAKAFLNDNKEEIRRKAHDSDIAKYLIDQAVMMVSISVIASFVYTLLPNPIQWILPEEVFVTFIGENTELLVELLIES